MEIRKEQIGHFTSVKQVDRYREACIAKNRILEVARQFAALDNKPGDFNEDAGTVVMSKHQMPGDSYYGQWNTVLMFDPKALEPLPVPAQPTPEPPPQPTAPAPEPEPPTRRRWYSWIPGFGGKKKPQQKRTVVDSTRVAPPPPPQPRPLTLEVVQSLNAENSGYYNAVYGLSVGEDGKRDYTIRDNRIGLNLHFQEDISGNLFIDDSF